MRSIIPSGKKMRKRIAKYPIPNFKIQIQFLNRNGEQFAFAVKSPGRFLTFRKNKRSCPTLPVSFCRRKEYTAQWSPQRH